MTDASASESFTLTVSFTSGNLYAGIGFIHLALRVCRTICSSDLQITRS